MSVIESHIALNNARQLVIHAGERADWTCVCGAYGWHYGPRASWWRIQEPFIVSLPSNIIELKFTKAFGKGFSA